MRYGYLLTALTLLLAGCGGEAPKEQEAPVQEAPVLRMMTPEELAGYYGGRLPGLDGKWYETTLYVRADGSYFLLEMDPETDSIPKGSIGEWQPVAGGLELDAMRNMRNLRWMVVGNGLRLDMREADPEAVLPKLAGELFDDTPRMRVLGNYRWKDDVQTFQPCGADKEWPAGMGVNAPEGEAEGPPPDLLTPYRAARRPPGQPLMVEVVGSFGLGPSMEDDVAEEYFFVHRLLQVHGTGHCR